MKKGIRTNKKLSKSENLKVLKEAKENGVKVTLDKYGVYAATYYNCKKSYDLFREDGAELNSLEAARKEITELELQLVHYNLPINALSLGLPFPSTVSFVCVPLTREENYFYSNF